MTARWREGCRTLVLGLALLLWSGWLAAESPRLGWVRLPDSAAIDDAVAARDRLQPVDPADVVLPPSTSGERHWLRWDAAATAGSDLLVVDRALFQRIEFFQRDAAGAWQSATDSFFQPARGEPLRGRYAMRLAAGDAGEVWLAVETRQTTRFAVRAEDERSHLMAARAAGNWSAAAYASLVSVAIAALALTLALRESMFRRFPVFAATLLLFLLACSGHLYELPGGGWLGALGASLPLAAGLATAAAALSLSNALLGLTRDAVPLARWVERAAQAGGALALLALAVPGPLHASWMPIATLLILLGLLAPVGLSAWSWSLGSRLATALCPLWAALLVLVGVRLGWMAGWWGGGDLALVYYPIGIAALALLLSIGLTDRMVAIRREHDLTRELHEESTANLQWEQHRRRFSDALRDLSRTANPGDLEWRALRLLLQATSDVVPARSFSISASGYRGFDYLLTEPMSAKAHVCAVLAERAATLKGICRSRTPIQVALEVPAVGAAAETRAQFAVVPLAVPKPGWGALLMERELGNEFLPDDLAVVGELVNLTLAAIEEGVEKAELKRDADLDTLTGLLTKRAGDTRLDALLRASATGKTPLSLLFIDVDQMVPINGKHGIDVGDECLRSVATALRNGVGKDDVAFRHGGDEFLAVLPGQPPEAARETAERVRAAVAALRIKSAAGPIKVTVSIGVAGRAAAEDTAQKLIDRAERAAGSAKSAGRNRVTLAVAHGGGEAPERDLHF